MILKKTTGEIAQLLKAQLVGSPDIIISKLNRIDSSQKGGITFLNDPALEKFLPSTEASCIILSDKNNAIPKEDQAFIKVPKPHESYVELLMYIDAQKSHQEAGIHPTAVVDPTATVCPSSYIGPYCIIGRNCIIGENTSLHSHVVLYDDCNIGNNCIINSSVNVYQETTIGSDCIIHSGAVIGSDGFGYIEHNDGSFQKIPQLGNVIIGNNVEIGANTTIDRAMTGSTIISDGVKLDNMVHIGHNVFLGDNTAIAAQAGLAGTTTIGKRNRIGGQAGFAGHLVTCDDVSIIAQTGVSKSIEKKGIYFGTPHKERLKAFKIEACLNHLPETVQLVNELKHKLEELDK